MDGHRRSGRTHLAELEGRTCEVRSKLDKKRGKNKKINVNVSNIKHCMIITNFNLYRNSGP